MRQIQHDMPLEKVKLPSFQVSVISVSILAFISNILVKPPSVKSPITPTSCAPVVKSAHTGRDRQTERE